MPENPRPPQKPIVNRCRVVLKRLVVPSALWGWSAVVCGFQAYPKHEVYELQNYHNEDLRHSIMPKTEAVY